MKFDVYEKGDAIMRKGYFFKTQNEIFDHKLPTTACFHFPQMHIKYQEKGWYQNRGHDNPIVKFHKKEPYIFWFNWINLQTFYKSRSNPYFCP